VRDLLIRLQAALTDRYRLDRELGAGGMATVYLAHDVRHGRPVALKLLRPELAAVIGAERFLAEIRTTANLQHPHILPLFDSGEADGFLFYVMPFEGGAPIALADATWGGGSWTPDGTIVYTPTYNSGLWKVNAGGGNAERLTTPDSAAGELAHWWPQVLPDGRHVVFTNFSTPVARAKIEVLDLRTGARKVLVRGAVFGRYLTTGQLVYASGESMMAVPFDLRRLAVTGPASPVLSDVATLPSNGMAAFTVSDRGDLAYVAASVQNGETRPVWVTRNGTERPVLTRAEWYADPAISPDGPRVAFTIIGAGRNRDIWVYESARDILTRITSGEGAEFGPTWSADGRRLIYSSERPVFDLYSRAADAGSPEALVLAGSSDKYAGSVSADGKLLAFSLSAPSAGELWALPLDGSGKARPLLQSRFTARRPAFAPNGRWLAYDSEESGRREVYLQSYPDLERSRRQVSTTVGGEPRWTRGGRELVYRNGDSVFAVSVEPASGETGRPAFLFAGPYSTAFASWGYDVDREGQRFLMTKVPPESAPRRIDLVLNWFSELKAARP
jgi:Tol biopolymer transport system component